MTVSRFGIAKRWQRFLQSVRHVSKVGEAQDATISCRKQLIRTQAIEPRNSGSRKPYPRTTVSDRISQTIATIVPQTIKTMAEMTPVTNSQSFKPARRTPVTA